MESVSISVCTESIKHQKENVPNINRPTTLMGGGQYTYFPNLFIGGISPAPFSYASVRRDGCTQKLVYTKVHKVVNVNVREYVEGRGDTQGEPCVVVNGSTYRR